MEKNIVNKLDFKGNASQGNSFVTPLLIPFIFPLERIGSIPLKQTT